MKAAHFLAISLPLLLWHSTWCRVITFFLTVFWSSTSTSLPSCLTSLYCCLSNLSSCLRWFIFTSCQLGVPWFLFTCCSFMQTFSEAVMMMMTYRFCWGLLLSTRCTSLLPVVSRTLSMSSSNCYHSFPFLAVGHLNQWCSDCMVSGWARDVWRHLTLWGHFTPGSFWVSPGA